VAVAKTAGAAVRVDRLEARYPFHVLILLSSIPGAANPESDVPRAPAVDAGMRIADVSSSLLSLSSLKQSMANDTFAPVVELEDDLEDVRRHGLRAALPPRRNSERS
jgi:hypothetical protein